MDYTENIKKLKELSKLRCEYIPSSIRLFDIENKVESVTVPLVTEITGKMQEPVDGLGEEEEIKPAFDVGFLKSAGTISEFSKHLYLPDED